jgi:metal-responsive CopG/Arc/MetJ family transcriptional regulator
VARQPVLVQLSDELLAALDQRAAAAGISRSRLIREALERQLADDLTAEIDRRIVEGYKRIPPAELDAIADAASRRLISEEPW